MQSVRLCILRLQGCKIQRHCDVAVLSRKGRIIMTTFEKLGIAYKEYDGLLYPVLSASEEAVKPIHIGKYGRMWIEFMKTEHPDRYRNLVRFGRLWDKATEIDEEAYELLEAIESKWLSSHKPKNRQSFWEMYQLRTQVRLMAEETVLHQVIRQYH